MKIRSWVMVLSALGLSLALACCGSPEGKKKPVRKSGGNAEVTQKLRQCRHKLAKSQKLGKDLTNQICVKDADEQIARFSQHEQKEIADAPSPLGKGYVVKEIPIRATISQSQDKEKQTSVYINADVRYSDELAESAIETLPNGASVAISIRKCVAKINKVLNRSHINLTLNLADDSSSHDDESDAQVIEIISLPQGTTTQPKGNPRLGLKYWPDHSDLYPAAASVCRSSKKCKNLGEDKAKCEARCIRQRTEPFCQSFAKLVAHWMNIKDPAVANDCRAPMKENPLAITNSLALGYLKPAKKISDIDGDDEAEADTSAGGSGIAQDQEVEKCEKGAENSDACGVNREKQRDDVVRVNRAKGPGSDVNPETGSQIESENESQNESQNEPEIATDTVLPETTTTTEETAAQMASSILQAVGAQGTATDQFANADLASPSSGNAQQSHRSRLDKKSKDGELPQKDDGDPLTYAKHAGSDQAPPTTAENFWKTTRVDDVDMAEILDPICKFEKKNGANAEGGSTEKQKDKSSSKNTTKASQPGKSNDSEDNEDLDE